MIVSPSLLSADFSNLAKDVAIVDKSKAEYIHVDVMDGIFVPNITYDAKKVKAIKEMTSLKLDTHLMVKNPEEFKIPQKYKYEIKRIYNQINKKLKKW